MNKINISGFVLKGDQYGQKIGFPTINIDRRGYSKMVEKPKLGVWAGFVILKTGKIYKAGIVIGPKDKKNLPRIEAHLLNFSGNLYGERVQLSLSKFIRPFKKFKTEKELIAQIKKDLTIVRLLSNF